MNITNVTVTKVAEESTENADYQLEYSIVNDALTRVHASIRKKDTDGSGNAPQIGIIYMEQGITHRNSGYRIECDNHQYVMDQRQYRTSGKTDIFKS